MNAELQERFDALEVRRIALTARVRAMSPEQQATRTNPKAFSPLELIQHFVLAENRNLQAVRNAPPPTLKGIKPRTRFPFMKVVETLNRADKLVGTIPSMAPKGPISLEEADRNWTSVRAELAAFLEVPVDPAETFCRFGFLFGTGSAADYLLLMEAHMHYHEVRFPVL